MKKNGTTTKGTTRWRCKNPDCGCSTTRHRPDQTHTRDFKAFHTYVTGTASLTKVADTLNVSRRTLDRRFTSLWLIDVPHTPDPNRVYDQIFIDGTYTDAGCLLVAASHDHVIAWHWTQRETAHAYTQLLKNIAPLRLPSFSGHPTCTDVVSVGEDVHCEPTTQEVHAGVPA